MALTVASSAPSVLHQEMHQVNVMVRPETIRLPLTVDTIDGEHDTVGAVTVGVNVNFQAYGLVELVVRVIREFLPCL